MKRAQQRRYRYVIAGLPLAWLLLFFLAPFALVLMISFADPIIGQPPYTWLVERASDGTLAWHASLENYRALFADTLYARSYFGALRIAFVSTVLCLLVGYPMAYAIARARGAWRTIGLLLVILPFWSSFLLRVYAWMGLLGMHGPVNGALLALGWIERPLALMYNDFAVYLGIVYTYLPFMILPLYAVLEKHERALDEAAQDLGARPHQVFLDVTLPLSLPGIVAGSLLVFVPAIGEFVIPSLLGGLDTLMIGRTLFDEFFINRDWPLAAAVATVLLAIVVAPVMLFQRGQLREHP
jgi:putrescine transport system permease protein